jgi:hypothetical protein
MLDKIIYRFCDLIDGAFERLAKLFQSKPKKKINGRKK